MNWLFSLMQNRRRMSEATLRATSGLLAANQILDSGFRPDKKPKTDGAKNIT
jgi:hypothetical protein